ncbi:MAG: AI-2E family transporter [Cyanobacteriota bacterium]|nr:AI-2E family transporter [Cyanobacteriota bacterium]
MAPSLLLIVLLGLLYLFWQIREILLLMFGAIVLAVAVDTLSLLPQRLGFRRGPSLAMTALTLVVAAILAGVIILPPLVEQFGRLFTLVPDGIGRAQRLAEGLLANLPTDFELPSVQELFNTLIPQTSQLISRSLSFFSSSLNVFINLFLVVILTVLLLVDPDSYINAFIRLFPAFYRPRIRHILQRCEVSLRGWLLGILLTSTLVMCLSGVGLAILGVPLVLANAVLAGVFNFIPNIGPTLSVVAPLTVALTDSAWKPIAVLILYITIQQVESIVLTPIIMSRQVALLPGFTLLAQVLSATFFGVLGLFLAVPLAAVAQVWIQEVLIHDVLDPWQGSPTLAEGSVVLQLSPSDLPPDKTQHPPRLSPEEAEANPEHPAEQT